MSKLDSLRLVYSEVTNQILLARFGANPNLALERQNRTGQVIRVFLKMIMQGKPAEVGKTWEATMEDGEHRYRVTLEVLPLEEDTP